MLGVDFIVLHSLRRRQERFAAKDAHGAYMGEERARESLVDSSVAVIEVCRVTWWALRSLAVTKPNVFTIGALTAAAP